MRERPVLIFDGDCGFCRAWVRRWQDMTGDRVEYAPAQEVADQFPQIPADAFKRSVQWVEPDGSVANGADAVFRALAHGGHAASLWAYRHVPLIAPASELAYRFVARHRQGFSTLTRLLWGRHVERPTWRLATWLFVRVLGLVYLIAFASLATQIIGLVGANGITPAAPWLDAVERQIGTQAYWRVPTLCWFGASDAVLRRLCVTGVVLSLLLVAGITPKLVRAVLWALYLSLVNIGQNFLSFQWDALLLETGFLAIFLAPATLLHRPTLARTPSAVALFLLRWLLFRLMFLSGLTKLTFHDPTWHGLSALQHHYETQPLPIWTSWYAHNVPAWFGKFSCGLMFVIELGLPFLMFAPRRLRLLAAGGLLLLQGAIAATGNYAFFNLLAAVLCLLLLDDAFIRRFVPRRWRDVPHARRHAPAWRRLVAGVFALLVVAISTLRGINESFPTVRFSGAIATVLDATAPFRTINAYGLFRVMTTTRPEIVIEGSDDGVSWREYAFRWKPGDLRRAPRFVAPHMPRLDWQMWFAALGGQRERAWFGSLLGHLLRGTPEVLGLLGENPFPDRPPRYVRAVLYHYAFTDAAARSTTGSWWRRERLGLYWPAVSMRKP